MQESIEAHTRVEDIESGVVVAIAFDDAHEASSRASTTCNTTQDAITTTNHIHEGEWCLETCSVVVRPSASASSPIVSPISMP